MKEKTVDRVILVYKFWSAALLAVFIFKTDYRKYALNIWWISTAALMIWLLINLLFLMIIRKKKSKDRLKELTQKRKHRLHTKVNRIKNSTEDEI